MLEEYGLKPIAKLSLPAKFTPNDPGQIPKFVFPAIDQLVVNDEYQRSLTKSSVKMILSIAENWDWRKYKAISLAPTELDGYYEVVDGQHTAFAAACNGNIPILPGLLMDAETIADRAVGFLGINTSRINLTKAAIYNAEVAAKDTVSMMVETVLSQVNGRVLAFPPAKGIYKVGDTLAIGALKSVVIKQDHERLKRILNIAVRGKAAPISACLIKALNIVVPKQDTPELDTKIARILEMQDASRLELVAKTRTPHGRRVFESMADMIADLAKMPSTRQGFR